MEATEEKKVAVLTLEVEGKKEIYVIAHDPIVEGIEHNRFSLASEPQKYAAQIQAILAIKGQKTLIPKAEYDKLMADRKKGIYEWIQTGGR